MLLPGMPGDVLSFVAVDDQQHVIGAVSATRTFRRRPPVGPGIGVHVIAPCRRNGIGRKLIDELAKVVRQLGAAALYAAARVEPESESMRGWQWLGFEAAETVESHTLQLDRLENSLAPLLDRLRKRGRVPASAQIIPLYRADLHAVLQLHLHYLGGDSNDLARRLRGEEVNAFLPQQSQVLLIDGKVKGCILGRRKDAQTVIVDANIIDRGVRGTWANLWLRLETARGVRHLGIRNIEFTTFDHYADTRSITEKLGGVTKVESVLMYRPIDGAR